MPPRKSEAVQAAAYKKFLEDVKKITFASEPQEIKVTEFTKGRSRHEVFSVMVDMGILTVTPRPSGKGSLYTWNLGNQVITDKLALSVLEKLKDKVNSYQSNLVRKNQLPKQSPVAPNANGIRPTDRVKRKYAKRKSKEENGEKPVRGESIVRSATKMFNLNHLDTLRRWPLDRPTDIQIHSTDTFMFQNADDLSFIVEGSDLILEISSRNEDNQLVGMASLKFKNVGLTFGHRGPENAKTASLHIEVIRMK